MGIHINKHFSYIYKNRMSLMSLLLFLFVNGLFIVKYISRISINPIYILLAYSIIFVLIFFFTGKSIVKLNENTKRITYWITVILTICGILILHKTIDPFTIQVDRWSAIHNFINLLFQGKYPYLAQTHLGGYGSPFPFWQLFHIPFYLLGNVGLGMLFTIILLSISLIWILKSTEKAFFYLLLLVCSPAFWYEVLVRSDLLYNFILCFLIIAYIHRKNLTIKGNAYLLGLICGLILSTRLSVVIPFAIYLLPDLWRSGIKQQAQFLLTGSLTFILTFVPLLIWDFNALIFFEFNPIALQSRQGSPYEIVILIVMIMLFAFKWKDDFTKQFFYTGITIVIFVGLTFIHRMISADFSNGLFSSSYDITYFNMALPYIIYSLSTSLGQATTPSLSNS